MRYAHRAANEHPALSDQVQQHGTTHQTQSLPEKPRLVASSGSIMVSPGVLQSPPPPPPVTEVGVAFVSFEFSDLRSFLRETSLGALHLQPHLLAPPGLPHSCRRCAAGRVWCLWRPLGLLRTICSHYFHFGFCSAVCWHHWAPSVAPYSVSRT
ncbi:hypothetical protein DQ04_07531000 [Trypanosoma grayi]|uniref:hypothetical protein n=1 Tax=Trypanosoma grayi TaxID=71804 RepID=UPI0004F49313|nr:hypothetical protein DQ04_07531000 [Trypanosoma grayi]KEG08281.1 hypothetical protein DQ04_07531000 [Trypanosoma grayi]